MHDIDKYIYERFYLRWSIKFILLNDYWIILNIFIYNEFNYCTIVNILTTFCILNLNIFKNLFVFINLYCINLYFTYMYFANKNLLMFYLCKIIIPRKC